MTDTKIDYKALTLGVARNGDKYGEMAYDGHEISVKVITQEKGKYVHVYACSKTAGGLGPVYKSVGLLIKRGVGRYELSLTGQVGDRRVYKGTVADLAELIVRYVVSPR